MPYVVTFNLFGMTTEVMLALCPVSFGQDLLNKWLASSPNREILIHLQPNPDLVIWARNYENSDDVCLVFTDPNCYRYSILKERLLREIPEEHRYDLTFQYETFLNVVGARDCRRMDWTVSSGGYWDRYEVPNSEEPERRVVPYPSAECIVRRRTVPASEMTTTATTYTTPPPGTSASVFTEYPACEDWYLAPLTDTHVTTCAEPPFGEPNPVPEEPPEDPTPIIIRETLDRLRARILGHIDEEG